MTTDGTPDGAKNRRQSFAGFLDEKEREEAAAKRADFEALERAWENQRPVEELFAERQTRHIAVLREILSAADLRGELLARILLKWSDADAIWKHDSELRICPHDEDVRKTALELVSSYRGISRIVMDGAEGTDFEPRARCLEAVDAMLAIGASILNGCRAIVDALYVQRWPGRGSLPTLNANREETDSLDQDLWFLIQYLEHEIEHAPRFRVPVESMEDALRLFGSEAQSLARPIVAEDYQWIELAPGLVFPCGKNLAAILRVLHEEQQQNPEGWLSIGEIVHRSEGALPKPESVHDALRRKESRVGVPRPASMRHPARGSVILECKKEGIDYFRLAECEWR